MKFNLVIILSIYFCCSAFVNGQELIVNGAVKTQEGKPVQFATVALSSVVDTTLLVSVEITDGEGKFSISVNNKGLEDYLLKVSAIGFYPAKHKFLSNEGPVEIFLKEKVELLDEIEVTASRPLIEQKVDRLVVNVEQLIGRSRLSLVDVLSSVPGIIVSPSGDISFSGRPGIRVLNNGRPVNLRGQQLLTYLAQQSTMDLKTIELITNPSAKYDAEGTDAIIDFKFAKSTFRGLRADIYGRYGNGYTETASVGVYSLYNVNNWRLKLSVDTYFDEEQERYSTERQLLSSTDQSIQDIYTEQERIDRNKNGRIFTFGVDNYFNKESFIGMTMDIFSLNQEGVSDFKSFNLGSNQEIKKVVLSERSTKRPIDNYAFNIHYSQEIDTSGSLLYIGSDYYKSNRKEFENNTSLVTTPSTADADISTDWHSPQNSDIYTFQLDYVKVLPEIQMNVEAGLKASFADVRSNYNFSYVSSEGLDSSQIALFDYEEFVPAGYLQGRKVFPNNITVQVGLRSEYTSMVGSEGLGNGDIFKTKYFSLFPSLFIQKPISDNLSVALSYSRRINRPGFRSLNSFEFFETPLYSTIGNPDLQPSVGNNLELSSTLFNKYNLRISGYRQQDVIRTIITRRTDGGYNTTYANLQSLTGLDINFNVPYTFGDFINGSFYTSYRYDLYNTYSVPSSFRESQGTFTLSANQRINLPADITSRLSLLLRSSSILGVSRSRFRRKFSVSFEKAFFNENLAVSLAIVDPFNLEREVIETNFDNQFTSLDARYLQRGLTLNVSYLIQQGRKAAAPRVQRSNSTEKGRL